MIALIFNKQTRLSHATNKKFKQGEIVNFVQADAESMIGFYFSMGSVSTIPIVLIYSFSYLFYLLGLSFLAGLSVFFIALFFNAILGLVIEKVDTKLMKAKDDRMNHTTEALNNIKTLKFYSWTDAFEKEI